ncbi:MAG: 4Fe-4S binding protein, partial [Candidatus Helarchaeota archaeon]
YSILNGILGRFSSDTNLRIYLGKIYVNTELCNKCGDCEKICPADAIKLDPYPKISKKCTGCCGCINLCPNGALYTSKTKNRPTYKFDESLLEK